MCTVLPTEYTEWQRPLSGVHFILMEKSTQTGEGGDGGCTPTPFYHIYYYVQNCGLYAPAERADTPPLFLLYPYMYSVILPVPRTPLSEVGEPFHLAIEGVNRDLLKT